MEVTPGENQTNAQLEPQPAGQDQVLGTSDIAKQVKELEKALGPETITDTKTPGSSTVQKPEYTLIQTPESNTVQTFVSIRTPESNTVQTPESTQTADSSTVQTQASSQLQQKNFSQSESSTIDAKELQEGQEIYIQTEGLTVQLAEPGSDRIVIVNGPDGTTMHIQTPEGVPLEAVQALLGIEASDGAKVPQ